MEKKWDLTGDREAAYADVAKGPGYEPKVTYRRLSAMEAVDIARLAGNCAAAFAQAVSDEFSFWGDMPQVFDAPPPPTQICRKDLVNEVNLLAAELSSGGWHSGYMQETPARRVFTAAAIAMTKELTKVNPPKEPEPETMLQGVENMVNACLRNGAKPDRLRMHPSLSSDFWKEVTGGKERIVLVNDQGLAASGSVKAAYLHILGYKIEVIQDHLQENGIVLEAENSRRWVWVQRNPS